MESLLEPGQQFGDYHVQRLLGKGGMGEVYEAYHAPSGRRVALKVLSRALSSEDDRKRFLREGRLAASVSHPNCVYIYGTEEINGVPIIAMELAPGGTLKELVKRQGPLPFQLMVETALQLIAGLEAAQAAGVLHRDIKPSNCFIDAQGQVKIGDFGLSITTLAKDQSLVTLQGSFIGTPVFASPEQLRGDSLDVRSDIYSLGVTLYHLLTGKAPFEAENLVQLVAAVLERRPESPSAVQSRIPKRLSQVVLRCLEKDREQRFADYEELRQALLPFRPGVPTPAPLARRFVAGLIDNLFLSVFVSWPLMGLYMVLTGIRLADLPAIMAGEEGRGLGSFLPQVVGAMFPLLYFALGEGVWGAAMGKALLGLRVVGRDKNVPGFRPALLRSAIYVLVPVVTNLILLRFFPVEYGRGAYSGSAAIPISMISVVVWLLLFSTTRARNGFAGIHDLASRTRVIQKRFSVTEQIRPVAEEPAPIAEIHTMVGPYGVSDAIPREDTDRLLSGYDSALRRKVWLHWLPKGAPPTPPRRRDVSRIGRLRWLNGVRSADACWDAYEAPDGKAFLALLGQPQPWSSVRRWLLDLGEELAAAIEDESLPPQVGLDRVWIGDRGRARLLDVPAMGSDATRCDAGGMATADFDCGKMQEFLYRFACAALRGEVNAAGEPVELFPAFQLPLHALEFLNQIKAGAFQNAASVVNALRPTIGGRTEVTWRRRLAHVGSVLVLPTLLGAMMLGGMLAWDLQQRELFKKYPDIGLLQASLNRIGEIKGATADEEEERKALEVYVAGRFLDAITDPTVRLSPLLLGDASLLDLADRAIADHPNPTEEEIAAATERLKPFVDNHRSAGEMGMRAPPAMMLTMLIGVGLGIGTLALLVSVVLAFATRGGMVYWAFGVAVVSREGRRASRLRGAWRTAIAWSPWAPMVFLLDRGGLLLAIPPVIFGAGIVYYVAAKRSVQDRLAGTYLIRE